MTTWTPDELITIGGAEELQIASMRPDGTLRRYVRIWVVRVRDDLYVRSAYGPNNPWYRRAKTSGVGRIRADRCVGSPHRNQLRDILVKLRQTFVEGGEPTAPFAGQLRKVSVGHLPMADDSFHRCVEI